MLLFMISLPPAAESEPGPRLGYDTCPLPSTVEDVISPLSSGLRFLSCFLSLELDSSMLLPLTVSVHGFNNF